ncbi:MAG: DMT family transporter [Eubacterium sp.]
MSSKKLRHSFLLLLTALIWGIAFVAQSSGGDAVGPYTFNCIRSFLGAIILLPVIIVLDKSGLTYRKPSTEKEKKTLITGGICCGTALCLASNVQQLGLYFGASAGKAGFLTACYILLVPILGLFFKKKCGWNIWIGVALSLAGLYLLCMNGSTVFHFSDILLLLCAFIFSVHILIVDHFSPLVDGVRMSLIQFLVCGILTAIPMFLIDMGHSIDGIIKWAPALASWNAWIPILYAGFLSCGVAYTLQIVGQEGLNPTVASLLMSMESVFSVIAGWLLLGETMGLKELWGCALIFVAIVLAQIPAKTKR